MIGGDEKAICRPGIAQDMSLLTHHITIVRKLYGTQHMLQKADVAIDTSATPPLLVPTVRASQVIQIESRLIETVMMRGCESEIIFHLYYAVLTHSLDQGR